MWFVWNRLLEEEGGVDVPKRGKEDGETVLVVTGIAAEPDRSSGARTPSLMGKDRLLKSSLPGMCGWGARGLSLSS